MTATELDAQITDALRQAVAATTERENDFWYGVYYRLTLQRA